MTVESMFSNMRSLTEKLQTAQNNITMNKEILEEIQRQLNAEIQINKKLIWFVDLFMNERIKLYKKHNEVVTKLKNGTMSVDDLQPEQSLKRLVKDKIKNN